MYRNAEMVFTGTFHGTVFSIKSKKTFFNYTNNLSRIKKVTSLLSELDINEKTFDSINYFNYKLNYKSITKILEDKKKESILYLRDTIK